MRSSVDDRLPILLTSAITATAPFTTIADPSERVVSTLRALSWWMNSCADGRFVVCDGSGYDLSGDLDAWPAIDRSRLELLAFENDRDRVKSQGKGHGEGEIIRHALAHSATLAASPSFAKCTGRLWVENYDACRRLYNGTAGFSHFGFLRVDAIDTRFFIVQKSFFAEHLLAAYSRCDDAGGVYLENVYQQCLDGIDRKRWMLPVYPKIVGRSGTSGLEYRSSVIKRLGKGLAIRMLLAGSSAS